MADLGNDIKKYHAGELTPLEMNALEKKALSDSFLADALEGGESIHGQDFAADLISMQSSLLNRTQKRRILSPWIVTARIAAGLLILAVTSYVIFTLSDTPVRSNDLALNKPSASVVPDSTTSSVGKTEADKTEEKNDRLKNLEKSTDHQPAPAPVVEPFRATQSPPTKALAPLVQKEQKGEDQLISEEQKIVSNDEPAAMEIAPVPTDEKPKGQAIQLDKKVKSESVAGAQSNDGYRYKAKEGPSKIIRGKVTDAEDGSELPGVNVTIKGSSVGTITDSEGNFQLRLDNQNTELVFSFIGLQEIDVPVNDLDNINVKMEADVSALSEVVVVGYAPKPDDVIKEEFITYQLAEPVGGKKAFKNYLVEKMQYPQVAIENKIQGKVTVQFTVDSGGLLNDFKVLKGIGYGCDEEVIRLVKGGPKWTPTKRNDIPQKGKIKVRLRFALPD